jgi:hypothetical protein
VSLVELARLEGFEGNLEVKGEPPNRVLWHGVSQEGLDAINMLLEQGLIVCRSTNPLVYLIDGALLRYPIARRWKSYKKPHWMPVTFSTAPPGAAGSDAMSAKINTAASHREAPAAE